VTHYEKLSEASEAAFDVSLRAQRRRFFTRVERIWSADLAVIKADYEMLWATACSYTT
jgi:hypothetical protein